MNRWSLQIKITVIVAVITTLACIVITANSIISADNYYGAFVDESLIQKDAPQSIEGLPGADQHAISPDRDLDYQMVNRRFSVLSIIVLVLIVLLSSVLTYFLMGKTLGPLNRFVHSIRGIRYDKLSERIELPKCKDEIWQLTNTFNSMLGRLEEAFELKTQFAANAAHELKTPLTIMKSSLQVLEMEEHPSETDYREFIEDTREGIERLIKTVDSLMALTKEQAEEETEEIVLRGLLGQIAEDLKSRAEENRITIIVNADESVIWASRTLLHRMIYNLAENAVKYNRPGGNITLSTIISGGRLGIEVSDSGIGMDEEIVKHIFEPFYRADQSRSQKIPGSGLGLSIVRLIAERMDGQLKIMSEPDIGTTICFFFPKCARKENFMVWRNPMNKRISGRL
ncbi:HAMP domain-containing histidine kinase [Clostridioides sp. ES-S-0108-01]|uniref:sensor histidine kinase n=1 Tax=Clostridioides sp. ES-S-0108-01 TaxID=2770773 RepID=UPI001D0C7CCC|nr:HAMP domain-containing histidine kinase [Clostridioides sp. ES-S-0108-01]UDN50946.1 HAMP domain-containing histidine kinase [Clostridioides sp. ES-S-0107-01]